MQLNSGCLRCNSTLPQYRIYVHPKPRSVAFKSLKTDEDTKNIDVEATTKKFGLEAGLFKALTGDNKDGVSRTQQAKDLLTKYGSAYLITSISFAIVSFSICYFLVSAGVDVQELLSKVGLNVNETGSKVGTFAIAYAAHKALSPIRFPPTVALTPVVAKWIGKKMENEQDNQA